MSTPRTFSSAVPLPIVFDVTKPIARLQESLDPTNPSYVNEGQHENIRTLIKLDNKKEIWLVDGPMTTKKKA